MSACGVCGREQDDGLSEYVGDVCAVHLRSPGMMEGAADVRHWRLGYEREKARADAAEREVQDLLQRYQGTAVPALQAQLLAERTRAEKAEQRICDFQAAAMIDVGGMSGPCAVEPRHVEQHVTSLRAQLATAEAQAKADAAKLYELACKLERAEVALLEARALALEEAAQLCLGEQAAAVRADRPDPTARQLVARIRALAPAPERAEGVRRQCSPGEFGLPVRFEIEHEDGTIVRYRGKDAARHVGALNMACAIAGDRIHWPTALPEVSRAAPECAPTPTREEGPDLRALLGEAREAAGDWMADNTPHLRDRIDAALASPPPASPKDGDGGAQALDTLRAAALEEAAGRFASWGKMFVADGHRVAAELRAIAAQPPSPPTASPKDGGGPTARCPGCGSPNWCKRWTVREDSNAPGTPCANAWHDGPTPTPAAGHNEPE